MSPTHFVVQVGVRGLPREFPPPVLHPATLPWAEAPDGGMEEPGTDTGR